MRSWHSSFQKNPKDEAEWAHATRRIWDILFQYFCGEAGSSSRIPSDFDNVMSGVDT